MLTPRVILTGTVRDSCHVPHIPARVECDADYGHSDCAECDSCNTEAHEPRRPAGGTRLL